MINYLQKYLKYKNKYLKVKNQIGGMKEETFEVNDNGKKITADVLTDFICSISFEIMDDPVILSDGHSYERRSIIEWLKTHNTSPKTGAQLVNNNMIPNHTLKAAISEFKENIYNKKLNEQIGELEKLANSGNCCAQHQLALKYITGEGLVVQNVQKALELLKKSSNSCESARELLQSSDFKESIFKEGMRLYNKKDYNDAAMFWNEAVLLKHPDAHAFLSDMLIDGRLHVPIDKSRAFRLASDGVELGSNHSKGVLGRCFIEGVGVSEDHVKGFNLATESAQANSHFGQYTLGRCYQNAKSVAQDNTEAVRWFRLAVEQGYSNAQNELGDMLYYGRGVAQDYTEAVRLYHLAAIQGNPIAQINLGWMYLNSLGVPQNYDEAMLWFRLSAAQGNAKAQYNLGNMFVNGIGMPRDYIEAERWYRLSAEQGYTEAQNELGSMLIKTQNYIEAVHFFRLAADHGNSLAQYNLGILLRSGRYVEQDFVEAKRMFSLAASQGNKDAEYELNMMRKY
jgi:TPR repeat protein